MSIGCDWFDTNEACEQLGLKPKQLRKLRSQMKVAHHFRVKNPKAVRPEYLWHVARIEALLTPEEVHYGEGR